MKFTRINDFLKLFVVIFAIASLISVSLTSCGGGGGGGGGGGAASGPADEAEGEDSVAEGETSTVTPAPAPAPTLSSNADMVSFVFTQADNPVLTTNLSGNPQTVNDVSTVNVYYVYGSQQPGDLTALKPTIEISAGATVSPASGVAQDFSVPVNYTVIAQDGTTKIYTVTVAQRDATQRSITYDLADGSLNAATPAPELFNVEEDVTLPSGGNVTKPNYYFAGWTEQSGGTAITGWTANSHTEDVTLRAHWVPAPYVEDNVIYANGISVTVKNLNGKTMVSFKGENNDEINLCDINRASEYQDLTGYTLFLGKDGNVNASDIIVDNGRVTMTGGNLSAIYGYNGGGNNIPVNVRIELKGGSVSNDVVGFRRADSIKPNAEIIVSGSPTIGNKSNSGIWLNSFTSPCVTINDSISSASAEAITLIAAGATQNGTHVAEATSSSYADAGKFKLLNNNPNQGSLNVGKDDSYIVVIGSVELPAVPIWQNSNTFTLGSNHILQGGTYFSVFVDGGYFTVPGMNLTDENGVPVNAQFDMAVPYSETGAVTYVEGSGLSTTGKYQYIQFKSTSGEISSKAADIYLAGIVFHGTNVTVSVNLQTVPLTEIDSAGVTYFNGSFYKIIKFDTLTGLNPVNDKSWNTAYNLAKASTFNGLHGYLMTITSHVENKFIYDRVYVKNGITGNDATGWIGTTASENNNGYDSSTWTHKSYRNDWVWAAGPEAGQVFYTQRAYSNNGDYVSPGKYSSWNNRIDGTKRGTGATGSEPNNSGNEAYAQYVGKYYWNDLSMTKSGTAGQYVPGSFIVEYTAYPTNAVGHAEAATHTALSDSKTYSH